MHQHYIDITRRCQESVTWFLTTFGKTKHPSAGVIDLIPWGYQKKALKIFKESRFCITKKCRQSGLSKIAGAFATWYGMFFSNKTILIVSKNDEDAKTFLRDNVKFLFHELPDWMKETWHPVAENEHELVFPNGSRIRSLTSNPQCLRSNASSLNIIDEAAFIQGMSEMWGAGYSTLTHGGRAIIISTTAGLGGWYWSTYVDAEQGLNDFTPIVINWWDMTWQISYTDPLTGNQAQIAPTRGIRKCTTSQELEKYGPYWSPWLEEQYRGLQERGETWKFRQEVLAEFVGSGNTILEPHVLSWLQTKLSDDFQKVTKDQTYIHPTTSRPIQLTFRGETQRQLDADEGLWVWKKPIKGTAPKYDGRRLIDPGMPAHRYVAGIDLATGKGKDYFGMVVIDVDELEQVAEIMIRTKPKYFAYIADYIGRWYNNALLVVERNNGGDAFIDDLKDELVYPCLWRKRKVNDKPPRPGQKRRAMLKVSEYGFFTSDATKPILNKALSDYLIPDTEDGTKRGIHLYSRRLLKQLQIYVRKRDRAGHDTNKTGAQEGRGNYDDLVIATALAFLGINDAIKNTSSSLVTPYSAAHAGTLEYVTDDQMYKLMNEKLKGADIRMLPPVGMTTPSDKDQSIVAELYRFSSQLGSLPKEMSVVNPKKRYSW